MAREHMRNVCNRRPERDLPKTHHEERSQYRDRRFEPHGLVDAIARRPPPPPEVVADALSAQESC